jgi:flagellar M-ring protein FliF
MSAEQIRAIMNLTAYSVEGLAPENVSVVDTAGRLLSELVEDDFLVYPGGSGGAVSSVQRELEKMHERDLERKAQRMLEAVFGPGNAVVRVRVELDFARRNRTREEYVPQPNGKGVVRSRQVVEETYSGTGAPPGGGVGTATNIPGYASRQTTAEGSDYSKTDEVTNYEVSTLHQEETEAPGSVKRITASVMINGSPDEAEMRDELFASVATAIGINEERGDRLSLNFMKFAPGPEEMARAAAAPRSVLSLPIFWAAVPLGLLLVGGGVFFLLRRRRRGEAESGDEEQPLVVDDGKVDRRVLEGLANLERGNKDEIYVLEEQIGLYAENNPEDMAVILKQWLEEAY